MNFDPVFIKCNNSERGDIMALTTYEGVVEKGRIRLKTSVRLPENATVYVIVPEKPAKKKKIVRVLTPRLVHRKQASEFKMKVGKA
jgi:hypothetical protein